ncbi:MAG: hypothetical protein FWD03_01225 [Defluviitaleaceae bacterium]|nr:hypothetical protein [Defluviitaleaceae bacterium]
MPIDILFLLLAASTVLGSVAMPIANSAPVFSAGWLLAAASVAAALLMFAAFLFLNLTNKGRKWLSKPRPNALFSVPTSAVLIVTHFFFHWVFTRQPNAWPANLRPVFFIPVVFTLVFLCSLATGLLWRLLTSQKVITFLWGDEKDIFYSYKLRPYIHGALVIITTLFIVLIAGPVHIAAGGNMAIDGQLLLLAALICVGIGLLTASPIIFLGKKYKYLEGILTGLLLLVTLNAFIIPFQASILDGGELGTMADNIFPLIRNIALFIILFLVASKLRKNLRVVAIPLMIFTMALTIYNWQSAHTSDSVWYTRQEEVLADATTFSTGRNVVVIVTDMFQGTIADHMFEQYPHLLDDFDGFTLFTRAFTSFPFTRFSREMIQSGSLYAVDDFDKGDPQSINTGENTLAALHNSFMSDMAQAGARVNGFNISLQDEFPAVTHFNPPMEPLRLYGYALAASAARLTGYWTPNPFGGHALDLVMADSVSSINAHNVLVENFNVSGDGDKLLYFWDYTLHTPVVFGRDGTIRPEPAEGDDAIALVDEMYFGINQLTRLFDTMKQHGVYDNSLIIIVSDHGHGFGARDPLYLRNFTAGANSNGNFLGIFRYNTVLFVKPPYDRGTATISHDPAWSGDVRALIDFYFNNFYADAGDSPEDVMRDIRAQNPNVGILFGRSELTMPDMWNSTAHHEIVTVRSLYDIPAAFRARSGVLD